MDAKQLIISIFCCITTLGLAGITAYVYVASYDKQIKVAAQIEVEKAKVEHTAKLNIEKIRQEEGTKRTKERMDWIPWHSREK